MSVSFLQRMQKSAIINTDTTYGFYRAYDYSTSLSASTTLYGYFKPWRIFGDKINMIRHRFEPSVSVSWAPDFGQSKYGFWKTIQYEDTYGKEQTYLYSPFANGLFGYPGRGKTGSISFAFDNNLEMKVRSDKDSTGFKKVSLIDKFSLGMSYNMWK